MKSSDQRYEVSDLSSWFARNSGSIEQKRASLNLDDWHQKAWPLCWWREGEILGTITYRRDIITSDEQGTASCRGV